MRDTELSDVGLVTVAVDKRSRWRLRWSICSGIIVVATGGNDHTSYNGSICGQRSRFESEGPQVSILVTMSTSLPLGAGQCHDASQTETVASLGI